MVADTPTNPDDTVRDRERGTDRAGRPTLLAQENQQEALRNAGAGSIPDYAKQAAREGGTFNLSPEEAAASGAGFVQDIMRMSVTADGGVPESPPPGEGGGPEVPPVEEGEMTLTLLNPNTAVLDSADLTLTCTGTGFTANSVINFAGQDEPTTFVSPTEVTTGVKPSLGWGATAVDVFVKGQATQSETLQFTFTAA